jgi:rhomboid family GlyGly-CTERM serine protease
MNPVTLILFAALVALNLPLFSGTLPIAWTFDPARFAQGEWWRLFTHPFAHVSLYHLLLDAGAFALLWRMRPRPHSPGRDAFLLTACAAGSLGAALLLDPTAVATRGLCGLSGIGHGLMAYQGLLWSRDRLADRTTRRLGLLILLGVLGKSLFETFSGGVLFTPLHLGAVGTPIPACHLGGTLGGLLAALAKPLRQDRRACPVPARPGLLITDRGAA